jgi:hypothetical protein
MPEVGDRVGAISHTGDGVVYLFGYGIYLGDHVPENGDVRLWGVSLNEIGNDNPKIQLDDGNIVWGCECWWGPEEDVRKSIGDRRVEMVDIVAARAEMNRKVAEAEKKAGPE